MYMYAHTHISRDGIRPTLKFLPEKEQSMFKNICFILYLCQIT